MLAKEYRLKRKKEIERVSRGGLPFKEDFLILKLAKNNLNQIRFAFIVSQKISKKAILRNKIKRRLREMVRKKLKNLKKGIDVILIACPGIETKDFWEIGESLNRLFLKAKILEEKHGFAN